MTLVELKNVAKPLCSPPCLFLRSSNKMAHCPLLTFPHRLVVETYDKTPIGVKCLLI